MRYKLLGRSGLRVSEFALGTMTFGEDWGWGASKEVSRQIFDIYAEAGGNFIDTSCNYTNGTAEKFVGDFVHADREHFIVATKYTLSTNQADLNAGGNHRKNMMQSVNNSLKRLNTEYIDLLWLHMWDFTTPVEEVLRGLDDLVRMGKVMYVGVSDTPAWVVSYANAIADLRGWSRFVALQVPYSLAERDAERELIPMARALDLAFTPWGVLGGGVLTGKYNTNNSEDKRYNNASDRAKAMADEVMRVAQQVGRSPAQVAINWVRQQQRNTTTIPILGSRKVEQFKDNLASLEFELSDEQMKALAECSGFKPGFPLDFLTSEGVINLVYGKQYPLLDNHHDILR